MFSLYAPGLLLYELYRKGGLTNLVGIVDKFVAPRTVLALAELPVYCYQQC